MNLQRLRWQIIAATGVLTLAMLFGGNYLFRSQTLDEPLEQALRTAESVGEYDIERSASPWEISVRLNQVEDLPAAYSKLNGEIARILKGKPFVLKIEDQRTSELDAAFRRINLHLHEGLATGHYASMAERTESEARAVGARAAVTMDQDRIYLQLQKGTDYLYAVVERPQPALSQAPEGGFGL